MNHIAFFVPGEPKGQPRPRAFALRGRVRVYDPGTAEAWKKQVALAAREHLPPSPIATPALVHLRFVLPRPRAHYGRAGLKSSAPQEHASKPDVDNLAKAVLDALVDVGFLEDDRLVWLLLITKRYANAGPGCEVRIGW
jgi:Holliday junction resolvase RusA-like endonuclease